MKDEEKKDKKAHVCYICGEIAYGKLGTDFQVIVSRGQTRYYCQKCAEKIARGE